MLEILESPKHLVAMKLSRELSASDIKQAYKSTEEALKENGRISFFIEVESSMRLTFEGIVKDLVESVSQWGKLKHYYRAALVTDKDWLGAIARVEGLVLCSIDVRVFGHAERDKAFTWASESPEPVTTPADPDPAIRFIQTTSENVFAYEVDGRIRERDIKNVVKEISPYMEREGKFNVLARMKGFNGFDLLSVFDDALIRLKFKAPTKIGKYAVVGPRSWMRNLLELVNPLFSAEIRTFEADEEAAAWEWIGGQQALLPE